MNSWVKRRIKKSEAERLVADAYHMVLGREPDEIGLQAHVDALVSGRIDQLLLLKHLLESKEGIAIRQNVAAFSQRQTYISTDPEELVTDAYRMVLGREPDEIGLQAHVDALVSGHIDQLLLLKHLLESKEGTAVRQNAKAFIERQTYLSTDSEKIVTEAYELALGRSPDVVGMEYHSNALRVGQQDDFGLLRDLLKSPESKARMSRSAEIYQSTPTTQPQGVMEEIVLLIQELIAIRLTNRGCTWVLPPISPSGNVIPPAHVAGLIRTLVMLCETRSDLQQVH